MQCQKTSLYTETLPPKHGLKDTSKFRDLNMSYEKLRSLLRENEDEPIFQESQMSN